MSNGSAYPHSARWDSITSFGDDAPSFNPINFAHLRTKDQPTFDFSSAPLPSYNVSSFSHDLPPNTVQPNAVFGTNPHHAFASDDSFFNHPALYPDLPTASQRYGQLTPPDDLSPKTGDAKSHTAPPAESDIQSSVDPEEIRSDNKPKRSSAKPKDGPRKRGRKSTAKVETEHLPPEEAAKREQFLERNRVAAHKCRQKKKEWMVNLDDRCRDLQAHNKVLSAAVGELNEEVFRLKNILFQHTDCQFAPIQAYIDQTAEKLRTQAAALGGVTTAPVAQPPPPRPIHSSRSSMHSRYGSIGFEDAAESAAMAESVDDRAESCSTADAGDEAWISMLQTT